MSARILVVENDPMSRELARRVLGRGGYDVTLVNDGEEALRVAPRLKPDLVLMDLGLPGIDGVEATKRLKAGRATKAIPVAVLSAQAFSEDAERARAAGCVDYLTKPIGAGELLERVGRLIGGGNARNGASGSSRASRNGTKRRARPGSRSSENRPKQG